MTEPCPTCGGQVKPIHRKYQRSCSMACSLVERYHRAGMSEARFWAKVDKSAGDGGCWPWTGAVNSDGYGNFGKGRGSAKAHRVAWEMSVGPIPDGLQVLHHCDNPPCCNPAHLFLGTHTDNMRDMVRKGRDGRRRLNEEIVQQARRLWREGWTQRAVADRYGVSEATIFLAVHGQTWRHVDELGIEWRG
jgi:hypothetical protein